MKAIAAAAMIAFGLNLWQVSAEDSIPQLVAKTKPATIQIMASDENWSPIKTGTGFFVSPDGLVVTNYHVIQGASHLSGRTNEGAVFQFERVVALAREDLLDSRLLGSSRLCSQVTTRRRCDDDYDYAFRSVLRRIRNPFCAV